VDINIGARAAIAALLLVPAFLAGPAHAQKPRPGQLAWVQVIINGLGMAPPSQGLREAKLQDALYTHYDLRTQPKEKARLQFVDGTQLYINESTDAVLQDPLHTTLKQGELDQVDKHGSIHRIQVGGTVATANGTNFDVYIQGGRVVVVVDRGLVTVQSASKAVTLGRNQESIVTSHRPPGRPRPVDADAVIAWTRGFDSHGWFYLSRPSPTFSPPYHIAGGLVTGGGYLFGVNTAGASHGITEITTGGRRAREFGPTAISGWGLAVDRRDHLFALAGTHILEYTLDGNRIATIPLSAALQGGASSYSDSLAVDSHGNLWITLSSRPSGIGLMKLSTSGAVLATLRGSYQDAAVDGNDNVYVVQTTATAGGTVDHICMFSSSGQPIARWSIPGPQNSIPQFDALAVDRKGRVYAAAGYSANTPQRLGSIYQILRTGKPRIIWGHTTSSQAAGAFTFPSGVAVDSAGNLYVLGSNSLQKLPWFDI